MAGLSLGVTGFGGSRVTQARPCSRLGQPGLRGCSGDSGMGLMLSLVPRCFSKSGTWTSAASVDGAGGKITAGPSARPGLQAGSWPGCCSSPSVCHCPGWHSGQGLTPPVPVSAPLKGGPPCLPSSHFPVQTRLKKQLQGRRAGEGLGGAARSVPAAAVGRFSPSLRLSFRICDGVQFGAGIRFL